MPTTIAATRLHTQEFEISFAVARRVAQRILGEADEAVDDIAISAVERAIRRQGAPVSTPRAFVATVARHLTVDELRRRRGRGRDATHRTVDPLRQWSRRAPLSEQLPDPAGNPESEWIDRQEDPRVWLQAALTRLTIRQRQALLTPRAGPATAALRQARHAATMRLRRLARQDGRTVWA